MVDTQWTIHGREFVNCNCAYGCPCQFNGLPTHGNCQAVVGSSTGPPWRHRLDGLKFGGHLPLAGPDPRGQWRSGDRGRRRANPAQREALLRILSGQDTEPGATIFDVFATTWKRSTNRFSRTSILRSTSTRRGPARRPRIFESAASRSSIP